MGITAGSGAQVGGAGLLAIAPLTGPAAPFVAVAGGLASLFGGLFGGGGAKKKANDKTRQGYRDAINGTIASVTPTATAYADRVGGEFGSVIKSYLNVHKESGADQTLGADQELEGVTNFYNLFAGGKVPAARDVWGVIQATPGDRYQGTGIPGGFTFTDPDRAGSLVGATTGTITDAFRALAGQFQPQQARQAGGGLDPTYLILGVIGLVVVAFIVRR